MERIRKHARYTESLDWLWAHLVCSTHGVDVLGIAQEELELQHLVETVLLLLPRVLQVAPLLLQV